MSARCSRAEAREPRPVSLICELLGTEFAQRLACESAGGSPGGENTPCVEDGVLRSSGGYHGASSDFEETVPHFGKKIALTCAASPESSIMTGTSTSSRG